MKFKGFWILILSLILGYSSLFADTESTQRLYPIPVAEAEEILSLWLIDSGFEVSRTSLEVGQIQLKALKGNKSWLIILRPYSPLASYLMAEYTVNSQPDQVKLKELWSYLESYSQGLALERKNINEGIPTAVLYQRKSVVCIKANSRGEPIQFSGFIINKKGLIISTAHDLKDVQEVKVILYNGQEYKGDLVNMDSYRDLILIDINSRVNSSISLAEGRNLLEIGEKVYSIGCPLNHQGKVIPGIIDGLLKQENKLPLWQVDMETLPGSSGSPVFDVKGNLVGVVKGRYRGTDSKGFLIPMETLIEFISG
jgi:serine protease Do